VELESLPNSVRGIGYIVDFGQLHKRLVVADRMIGIAFCYSASILDAQY
jgi:hypothetical protein